MDRPNTSASITHLQFTECPESAECMQSACYRRASKAPHALWKQPEGGDVKDNAIIYQLPLVAAIPTPPQGRM